MPKKKPYKCRQTERKDNPQIKTTPKMKTASKMKATPKLKTTNKYSQKWCTDKADC